jgi:hypothetical protein
MHTRPITFKNERVLLEIIRLNDMSDNSVDNIQHIPSVEIITHLLVWQY